MIFTSILGVLTLVALAWALGFRRKSSLKNTETAATEAAAAIPGFQPAAAAVSDYTSAALVAAIDGRVAMVRCFGDRFVVRLLKNVESRLDGQVLHVHLREPGFPPAAFSLGASASQWAARL